jgi:hypothetical protein
MFKNVEEGAALGGYNSGIPVFLPAELTKQIETYGDYKHEGDIVRVKGVFNAASQHGGYSTSATSLEVTALAVCRDPVKPWKVALALMLAIGAGSVWYANQRAGAGGAE